MIKVLWKLDHFHIHGMIGDSEYKYYDSYVMKDSLKLGFLPLWQGKIVKTAEKNGYNAAQKLGWKWQNVKNGRGNLKNEL